MQRPSFIGNYLELIDEDDSHYPGDDELMAIGSAVGKKLGLKRIGIHIETLPPGRRTSWAHAESDEEEFAFVIEGHPDVWINGHLHPLRPGDFVAFPAGTGICHTFINNSPQSARLLVGGEASKKTNKIFYPMHDSRNVVLKTQERLWEDWPRQEMGPHDGRPDGQLNLKWNFPTIETQRFVLRPAERSDAAAMFDYASRPETSAFVSWPPHKSVEESENLIKLLQGNLIQGVPDPFVIVPKDGGPMIGSVGAFWNTRPQKIMELGAVLHPDHWGKGIVLEVFQAFIPFLWQNFDVLRIQGRCMVENTRSQRMMQKLGMQYEGTLRSSFYAKGRAWDMQMFALTRT